MAPPTPPLNSFANTPSLGVLPFRAILSLDLLILSEESRPYRRTHHHYFHYPFLQLIHYSCFLHLCLISVLPYFPPRSTLVCFPLCSPLEDPHPLTVCFLQRVSQNFQLKVHLLLVILVPALFVEDLDQILANLLHQNCLLLTLLVLQVLTYLEQEIQDHLRDPRYQRLRSFHLHF